jgi:hypothetical protein
VRGHQVYDRDHCTHVGNNMTDSSLLNEQEQFLLDTMKSVAKILNEKSDYREYSRRLINGRRKAAQGQNKEAAEEYDIAKTRFPKLWEMSQVLQRVYFEGVHDGAHRAAMQYFKDSQTSNED